MDRYVVVGNPIEHSQSPYIHAEFARETGQALEYGRMLWPIGSFAESAKALAASGARGCNVTVPFKFEAFHNATRLTPRARLAEAANVLTFDAEGGFLADNSDGIGLVNDIERNAGLTLAGARLLLIGAGGAAAGVLGPLLAAGPREIVVANRTLEKAQRLVERHRAVAGGAGLRASRLEDCGEGFDVVVNASASSLAGAGVPVADAVLMPGTLALDMMYGPAAQAFLGWAEARGARARDGLGMLVEQAAEAFAHWRGVRPSTAPVLAALQDPHGRGAPMMRGACGQLLRVALLLLVSAASLQFYFLGRVALMAAVDPQSTTFQRSEAWRLLVEKHAIAWSRQWVGYERISPNLKRAVIASEDSGFTEHSGVEWDALEKAWDRNQKSEARTEKINERLERRAPPPGKAQSRQPAKVEPKVVGGSTITQQLAKNLFLGSERHLVRKGQEFAITFMLEALLSKRRILEIYLNSVEWGEGVFGAEAASQHYFHVAANSLAPAQAAQLAVMLPAPKRFEKRPGSGYVVGRAGTVAARMGTVDVP